MTRRATLLAGLGAAALAAGPASASPEKTAAPAKIVFVGPAEGPLAATADESFAGVKAALAPRGADDVAVELTREAPKKAHAFEALLADLEKRGVALAIAFVADGDTPLAEKAAEKAKVPLLVLSPETTRADVDPNRAVFWAGGLRPTDEALYALDFLLTPLGVHEPAILHDGSPRAALAAAKCAHLCHMSQHPREPAPLAADFGVADVKGVLGRHATSQPADATSAGEGADGILYFGGPEGAERLCAACADAKIEAPVLLGEGLASRAVPTLVAGRTPTVWALEAQYIEDWVDGKGSPAPADAAALAEAAKETDGKLFAATVRGWRAGRWVAEALRHAAASADKKAERRFVNAMRGLERECARGKYVFEDWGHACLARFEAWHGGKWRDEPPFTRTRPGYLPIAAIPQVGFFQPSRFKWEPGSNYVWLHWGRPEERTIEKDLKAIGLDPGAYDAGLRDEVVDDLMGRTISRLNRLFLRNADGTAVPGVSFNVTFGTEEKPAGLKGGHRFEMVLRGDSQIAGGVAHGTSCEVFTTYIERTIYAAHALKPELSRDDAVYVNGTYRWGDVLARNLRGDAIRALHDGFTQAFALTGAHECGHMFGLDHDTTSPRSIMNVVEAADLDFDWAEWVPAHLKALETRLGRVPAEGKGR
jgi:ABC-type branched-subunit amino acid transport system substrate-binding protein